MNRKEKLKSKIKSFPDVEMIREINLVMDNEYSIYQNEDWLNKNYARKYKKGKFDFAKAQKGVNNLIVTPFARKYQNEWGVKVGSAERDAISKARLRQMLRRIRDGEY